MKKFSVKQTNRGGKFMPANILETVVILFILAIMIFLMLKIVFF
jgi:hypothetical protein